MHHPAAAVHALQANQPAFYVPQYLQSAGVEVVPVPVFFPDATHILGQPVYRRVQDVPGKQAEGSAELRRGKVRNMRSWIWLVRPVQYATQLLYGEIARQHVHA
jgi:hypothetical protein